MEAPYWDRTVDGYACFIGPLKVCVMTTKHYMGLARNGVLYYEELPKEQWGIHWTSPAMKIDLIRVVLASVPETA